jgi:hypothetical protein
MPTFVGATFPSATSSLMRRGSDGRVATVQAQTNIDESLFAVRDRIDPDDEAHLLTLVLSRDLPTAGSGYVDTYQHSGSWAWKRIRRNHRKQRWSGAVDSSS